MNLDSFLLTERLHCIHVLRALTPSVAPPKELHPAAPHDTPTMNPQPPTPSKPIEPGNITECKGNRFDAIAMAEDPFFYDLVCAFTKIVLDHYRAHTGMTVLRAEHGLYSVNILRGAGPAPRNGSLDRRVLNVHSRTLHVEPCSNPARCQHGCIDVQAVTRRFMYWFIEWRARIQRPMPPPLEFDIGNVFRLHSERCVEDDETDWDWRRYAIYNLIREIRDPVSSRRGYIKPEDGEPIRRPWEVAGHATGDQFIHGVLNWRSQDNAYILRELLLEMKSASRERRLRRRDPELMTDLWDMAWRERPDLATLPQMFPIISPTSNPKRERDREQAEDLETRPAKTRHQRRRDS